MEIKTIDIARQYQNIKEEVKAAIDDVLEKQSFILGEQTDKLEKKFAEYCGVKYGIGCSSGSSALFLALEALNLNADDEVITTPLTFIATVASIISAKLKPVFVDVEEDSYNIDCSKIEKAITSKTKVIMPVHLYGQPCDMDKIADIAQKHNLIVIEDCAQAHGALFNNQKIGSFGKLAGFSFYPGKNLGAYGDAGIITTDDSALAKKLSMIRDHGRDTKYYHTLHGYNHRIDGIQSAVLNVKLKYLDDWNTRRIEIAELYKKYLSDSEYILPAVKPNRKHVYHIYAARHPRRDAIVEELKKFNIFCGIHYNIPVHLQQCYEYLGKKKGDFPIAEKIADEVFSLPMFPELTDEEVKYTADSLKKIQNNKSYYGKV